MKKTSSVFGERLTEAMQSRGVNQTMLAKMLNTTQQTVSRWCNGMCEPDYDMLLLLCGLFDETPNNLLNYDQEAAKRYALHILDNFVGNDKQFQKEQQKLIVKLTKEGATEEKLSNEIDNLWNKRKKEIRDQLGLD